MALVMLARELQRGWVETVSIKRMRQRAQDRQKVKPEEETEQD